MSSCPVQLCARKGTNCHSLGFGAQVMSIHSTYFALLHFLGSWAGVIPRNCQWNVQEFNMFSILAGVRGREHEHDDSARICMNMPIQWSVFRSHSEPILYIIWKGSSDTYYITVYYLANDHLKVLLQTWALQHQVDFPEDSVALSSSSFGPCFWMSFEPLGSHETWQWDAVGADATWCKIRGAKQRGLWDWRQIYVKVYICRILRLYIIQKRL